MFSVSRIAARIVLLTPVILGLFLAAYGQTGPATVQKQHFEVVPGGMQPQLNALGIRAQRRGTERTVLIGQFVDAAGHQSPAQVIQQVPNLVDLQGFAPAGDLKFDGTPASAIRRAQLDEALLEVFVTDTAEGMLSAVQTGAAVRLLGRNFKPDIKLAPSYSGPTYDIFEVTAPVAPLAGQPVRMKLYYFDSHSGLLLSTRYSDTSVKPAITVETRFSKWRIQDGSAYPGRIERYESGMRAFSFVITAAANGPAVDLVNFR